MYIFKELNIYRSMTSYETSYSDRGKMLPVATWTFASNVCHNLISSISYNFIRHQLSQFYFVQKYHFFMIENGKLTVITVVISHKLLHATL